MKNIAVLTFHFPENMNFGASLQSYAGMKMIESLGYNVELIDYNPEKLSIKGQIAYLLGGLNFKYFCKKFLKLSKKCIDFNDLKFQNQKYDYFIVGSDQVWRPKWLKESLSHYYFDFVNKDKIKIAYAASFGVDFWEGDNELTEKIKKLAKEFNYVSVREESGIKICQNDFGIDAICVLDPTLMINKEEYTQILKEWKGVDHLSNKYVASMLLDDSKELSDGTKEIANYLDSKINYIKGKELKIFNKKLVLYNKVSQWLSYVKDAELVITDSFHCTVFSLIFNKKFIVVANPTRGITRLENLLEIVGLKERFFTNINDAIKSGILDKEIDYKEVENKLEKHKEFSMKFLKRALEENNK